MTLSTDCTCWLVTRADGLRQGFTDHDASIAIEGVACEAVAALDASEARTALGVGADAQDIAGALDSASISERAIAAGLYDDAAVEVWRVDWRDPAERRLLRRATLGEITRADGAFTAELRGLAHRLDRTDMRRFARSCDAALGDERCGVDLAPFTRECDARFDGPATIVCAAAEGPEDGWFSHGVATFLDGENAGRSVEIASHVGSRLSLWREPPFPPGGTVRVRLVAGCDKRFETCRARFANAASFRGFPHMPGGDFTLGYASGRAVHDGKATLR